jgi:rRNA maturation endonuclease Nob1
MLVVCERCKRHFSADEDHCPFCKHQSAFVRIGAAALAAGALLGACDAGKDKNAGTTVENRAYATLHGVVKDKQDGTVLAGTQVHLNSIEQEPNRQHYKSVPTDAKGRYSIDLLEPGKYTIAAFYNGGAVRGNTQLELTLAAGEDRALDITIERQMDVAPPYGAPPARRRIV